MTKFDLIMIICFIQFNESLEKYVNAAQNVYSLTMKFLIFCQFYFHLRIAQIKIVTVAVHDNI